jgi:hypothetical protein
MSEICRRRLLYKVVTVWSPLSGPYPGLPGESAMGTSGGGHDGLRRL